MINYAVIGTSNITTQFISAAEKTGRFNLQAVYSRTVEKGNEFASRYNCKTVYTTLEDLVADTSVTAVYVASPNALHFNQCKFLLQNGKHVICEKTITQTPQEFLELKEIADRNNLIIMDAIISQYSFARNNIKSAISKIGNIKLARIDFSKLSAKYFSFLNGEDVNIFNMSLGAGTLTDIGVYCVYAAVDLLGVPKDITAFATFLQNGADGNGIAVFRYDNFDAVLTYGKTAETIIGSEILGDNGAVKIGKISLYSDASLVQGDSVTPLSFDMTKIEIMKGEADAFADYIENFSQDKQKYEDATKVTYDVLVCMEKIKKSAGIFYPKHI